VNCRENNRDKDKHESYARNDYSIRPSETQNIIYNRFESLSNDMECYKCNNFGHMAKYCRVTIPPIKSKQNNNGHR
jgi:hypothetical protein